MTITGLTPLSTPPGRAQDDFDTAMATTLGEIDNMVDEFNEIIPLIAAESTNASSVATSAAASQAAATAAAASLAQVVAAVNANSAYPPQLVTSYYDPTNGLPSSPVVGQAHVATATANGWTAGKIYKRTGTAWAEYAPATGWLVLDVSSPAYWVWSGSAWARRLTAFDISIGIAPDQVPTNAMLGTNAYLDQTWLYAATTWDAPSVANGAQTSTPMAVPGAGVGDYVMVSCGTALSGLRLWGEVTAQDIVTLYLFNATGSAVDLASATYYVAVLKRTPAR